MMMIMVVVIMNMVAVVAVVVVIIIIIMIMMMGRHGVEGRDELNLFNKTFIWFQIFKIDSKYSAHLWLEEEENRSH